jgi:hypothetical protein
MPYVGFEPTIPASERAKTVHASDRSATVTRQQLITYNNNNNNKVPTASYLTGTLSYNPRV